MGGGGVRTIAQTVASRGHAPIARALYLICIHEMSQAQLSWCLISGPKSYGYFHVHIW
jgi:hypothetical protein